MRALRLVIVGCVRRDDGAAPEAAVAAVARFHVADDAVGDRLGQATFVNKALGQFRQCLGQTICCQRGLGDSCDNARAKPRSVNKV